MWEAKMQSKFLQFGFTILTSLCCTLAHAIPVTVWNYSATATFDSTSIVWDSSGGTHSASSTSLSWGENIGNGQSGLTISNSPANGTVVTNGALAPAEIFSHNNRPITGQSLSSVTVKATITLTPNTPALPGAIGPLTTDFKVNFLETPNVGPCVVAPTNPNNPCPDIFVLSGNLNFPFTYDSQQYFASFVATGLNTLPTAACLAAGASAFCNGFVTQENANNTAQFFLAITSRPVQLAPEPNALLLVGMVCGAITLVRRRKST